MSNLVKSFFVYVNPEDGRMIDNNDLADQMIQVSREEDARRKAAASAFESGDDEFGADFDGFSEGFGAEQLDGIPQDANVVGDMPSEMSLGDFGEITDGVMDGHGGDAPVPPEIQKEVDQILEDAQTQANQIVADARSQAESIKEKARQEGHEQGYKEGVNEGKSKGIQEVEEHLASREQELQDQYERLTATIEPEMVDTLTKIYEHVFNVSFREDKDIILHLLQTALSRIEPSGILLVHISPDDYDMVQDSKQELMQNITSPDVSMELVEDPTLQENECIIETDGGIFDCSLGVELEEISRKLKLLSYDRR